MIAAPNHLREDALYIVDGSGYIFRAYYAIRPLSSSKGVPTNAVYGFTTMLLKLLKEHQPRHLAMAFDTGKPSFRKNIYPLYKANRPPPPPDLVPQFDWIHQVVKAFGIPCLSLEGFEADDIIGTLTQMAKAAGRQVIIVTGDKDLMQLVDTEVWLLDELRAAKNGSEELIDRAGVKAKFGIEPEQVIDILALAGDSSDNVPGVKGIGEKTARDLVQEYGKLETIINAAPLMKQKGRRDKLLAGIRDAQLSKQLVTLDCNCPLPIGLDDLAYRGPHQDQLRSLFEELDFKRLTLDPFLFHSGEVTVHPKVVDYAQYQAVTREKDFQLLLPHLQKANRIAIDTETDGLDDMQCKLMGISLAYGPNQAVYIPVGAHQEMALEKIQQLLQPILSDTSKVIVAQHAKFDQKVLKRHGFSSFRIGGDPMLASYLLEADAARHNLDELSKKYLHHTPISYEDLCGTGKNLIPFAEVPLDKATAYSAEDADVTLRLSQVLEQRLAEENMTPLYYGLELPLEEVLTHMEMTGVKIDAQQLKRMSEEFKNELAHIEQQAYDLVGYTFNLASPKQVADVLFGKLQLEPVKKTKTGQSTDADVLEILSHRHPLPKLLLEHRLLSKLLGTYVDALPALIHPQTGRLHTRFNQAVTATGRLSSSDPNLQNIPIRSKEGRRIREAFIAEPGNVLISLDYSQIELRILAQVSQDPVMLDAFHKGEDVHQRTASEIFEIPLLKVDKEQRNIAKTINFGLLYGMGVHRLSQTLGIPRAQASDYLKRYYERYAGIFNWQKKLLEEARQTKEVRTLLGRRRFVPEITSDNRILLQRAERIAINTPIQGTAADMIKKAMIEVDRELYQHHPAAKMVLQVHDELLIETPSPLADEVESRVKDIMCHAMELAVPILVESAQGASWAEAH